MDTPLVKILLIAAAIAITVGVTVLAWSIFNEGSAEVSTDQDDRAIANLPGTRADGVRARIDNERACEALGSAHWYAGVADVRVNNDIYGTDTDPPGNTDSTNHQTQDHPATRVNEAEPHCAAGADERSEEKGLTQKIWLHVGPSANDDTNAFKKFVIR